MNNSIIQINQAGASREIENHVYLEEANKNDTGNKQLLLEWGPTMLEMSLLCYYIPSNRCLLDQIRETTKTTKEAAENVVETSAEALATYSEEIKPYIRNMVVSCLRVPLDAAKVLEAKPRSDKHATDSDMKGSSLKAGMNIVSLLAFSDFEEVPRVIVLSMVDIVGSYVAKFGRFGSKADLVLIAMSVISYVAYTDWVDSFKLPTKGESIELFKTGSLLDKGKITFDGTTSYFKLKYFDSSDVSCCGLDSSCEHWLNRKDLLRSITNEIAESIGC